MVKMCFIFYFFEALLWSNGLIFSTFLYCSEENFVRYILRMFFLVLAHLELKLGLFEVDDIGDLGDDDL